MATFTITVPDAVVPRVLNAYGTKVMQPDGTLVWTPATAAQMPAIMRKVIQAQVALIQSQQSAEAVNNEVWS